MPSFNEKYMKVAKKPVRIETQIKRLKEAKKLKKKGIFWYTGGHGYGTITLTQLPKLIKKGKNAGFFDDLKKSFETPQQKAAREQAARDKQAKIAAMMQKGHVELAGQRRNEDARLLQQQQQRQQQIKDWNFIKKVEVMREQFNMTSDKIKLEGGFYNEKNLTQTQIDLLRKGLIKWLGEYIDRIMKSTTCNKNTKKTQQCIQLVAGEIERIYKQYNKDIGSLKPFLTQLKQLSTDGGGGGGGGVLPDDEFPAVPTHPVELKPKKTTTPVGMSEGIQEAIRNQPYLVHNRGRWYTEANNLGKGTLSKIQFNKGYDQLVTAYGGKNKGSMAALENNAFQYAANQGHVRKGPVRRVGLRERYQKMTLSALRSEMKSDMVPFPKTVTKSTLISALIEAGMPYPTEEVQKKLDKFRKNKKAPSEYNKFIQKKLKNKNFHGKKTQKQRLKEAAKAWTKYQTELKEWLTKGFINGTNAGLNQAQWNKLPERVRRGKSFQSYLQEMNQKLSGGIIDENQIKNLIQKYKNESNIESDIKVFEEEIERVKEDSTFKDARKDMITELAELQKLNILFQTCLPKMKQMAVEARTDTHFILGVKNLEGLERYARFVLFSKDICNISENKITPQLTKLLEAKFLSLLLENTELRKIWNVPRPKPVAPTKEEQSRGF